MGSESRSLNQTYLTGRGRRTVLGNPTSIVSPHELSAGRARSDSMTFSQAPERSLEIDISNLRVPLQEWLRPVFVSDCYVVAKLNCGIFLYLLLDGIFLSFLTLKPRRFFSSPRSTTNP